jgi:small subunit ribosomal protein S20
MATSKVVVKKSNSELKRKRQTIKREARKTSVLSRLKTEEKKLRAALHAGVDEVTALYQNFSSALDKAAKKGAIHKNVASRKKSRLNTRIAKGAKQVEAPKKKTAVKKVVAKTKAKLKPKK